MRALFCLFKHKLSNKVNFFTKHIDLKSKFIYFISIRKVSHGKIMNIQTLPWLKFAHEDYIYDLRIKANAVVKAAFLDLLCLAMKQTPALSIPNDDQFLATWLNMGVKRWLKIKNLVLSQFALNADNNRYYSIMLVEQYQQQDSKPQETDRPVCPTQPAKTAKTNAERQAEYKARQKAIQDQRNLVTLGNETSNTEVTDGNVTSNADFVTFGGIKGGDLDLIIENEDKNTVVVVREQAQATTATPTILMSFYFEPDQANVSMLMEKLEVDAAKNNNDNLNNFIAYYCAKGFKNTQAEWDLQYVKWLKREKDKPKASLSTPTTTTEPKHTPVPVVIGEPIWETMAKQKAEREAKPQKDAQSLAAGNAAFAAMKKTLGIRNAA